MCFQSRKWLKMKSQKSVDLKENEEFFIGMTVGISIYQQKVITAHKRKEPLKIGDSLYYFENGRERLERMFDEICR